MTGELIANTEAYIKLGEFNIIDIFIGAISFFGGILFQILFFKWQENWKRKQNSIAEIPKLIASLENWKKGGFNGNFEIDQLLEIQKQVNKKKLPILEVFIFCINELNSLPKHSGIENANLRNDTITRNSMEEKTNAIISIIKKL